MTGRAWIASFQIKTPGDRALDLVLAPGAPEPAYARNAGGACILDGVVHNRAELERLAGSSSTHTPNSAALILSAYRRHGEEVLHRLQGNYAIAVWDSDRELLLCSRDAIGAQPLFYSDIAGSLLLSPSIESLLAHPRVSAEINRAGLVDRLGARWSNPEETDFVQVQRLPPGHVIRMDPSGRRIYRYWDVAGKGDTFEWIPDGEAQTRVDKVLENAIERSLELGSAAVFLSGGLDSAAIATVAADISRQRGMSSPQALSVVYPEPHDEQRPGRGVAAALGLPQMEVPFADVAGQAGLLSSALELTATLPAPLFSLFMPMYTNLAGRAKDRGCEVILTGLGGDEWAGINAFTITRDLLRSADLRSIYRLWRADSRLSPRRSTRAWWVYCYRPFIDDLLRGSAAGRSVAARLHARSGPAPISSSSWVAPDPTLRTEVARRLEATRDLATANASTESAYIRGARWNLDNPRPWMRQEEQYLLGRRSGIPQHNPFWDREVVEVFTRVHPLVRTRGGLTKAMLRENLVRRYPELGFDRQVKALVNPFVSSMVRREAHHAFETLGGVTSALGDLGIVDVTEASAFVNECPSGRESRVWDVLNLEAWARAHT